MSFLSGFGISMEAALVAAALSLQLHLLANGGKEGLEVGSEFFEGEVQVPV